MINVLRSVDCQCSLSASLADGEDNESWQRLLLLGSICELELEGALNDLKVTWLLIQLDLNRFCLIADNYELIRHLIESEVSWCALLFADSDWNESWL